MADVCLGSHSLSFDRAFERRSEYCVRVRIIIVFGTVVRLYDYESSTVHVATDGASEESGSKDGARPFYRGLRNIM